MGLLDFLVFCSDLAFACVCLFSLLGIEIASYQLLHARMLLCNLRNHLLALIPSLFPRKMENIWYKLKPQSFILFAALQTVIC